MPYVVFAGAADEPQRMWVSDPVFELVTQPYDLEHYPDPSRRAAYIRELAEDRSAFRRIREGLASVSETLPPTDTMFRARVNCEGKCEPWAPHEMRGNPEYPAQRANLQGEPVVYCADSDATALREVRCDPGTLVTVATLRPSKPLSIVSVVNRFVETGRENPFEMLDLWMREPVTSIDSLNHYWNTRLFSTVVRVEGYDGVKFSSSLSPGGINYALFDPYSVDVVACALLQVP